MREKDGNTEAIAKAVTPAKAGVQRVSTLGKGKEEKGMKKAGRYSTKVSESRLPIILSARR